MRGTTLGSKWTVRDVLNWTRDYFEKAGIVQPRLEAEILLAHALDVDRLHLYLNPDKPLTLEERESYREIIKQRGTGKPLQQLTGKTSFFGLPFEVGNHTFIPRPETEELVDWILQIAPRDRDIDCLDLGTGSGVIAVCLARFLPLSRVTAVDISDEALQLAQKNAEINDVSDKITFLESDWFKALDGKFDLIVANPPYVASEEFNRLPKEVLQYEPQSALNGGRNGLEQLEAIIGQLPHHMRAASIAFLEIGDGQGKTVVTQLEQCGFLEAELQTDLAGHERFVIARWPS
jgi:release factor glutamine methyltransferase